VVVDDEPKIAESIGDYLRIGRILSRLAAEVTSGVLARHRASTLTFTDPDPPRECWWHATLSIGVVRTGGLVRGASPYEI